MDSLITEYEDTLIGRMPHGDVCNFYGITASNTNEQKAIMCVKYVIEKVLLWDENEAINKFDEYIINLMKLNKIIDYIDYPVEVPHGDPRYILSLLYPRRVRINKVKLIEETYAKVLENKGKQFPREYFVGGLGFQRFCICFKYLLENIKTFDNVEEIYDYFDSPEGKKMLYDYRLKVPADQFFINIFDVIHCVTGNSPHCDLWYFYKTFCKNI